jgi:hypothetical protein
MYLLVNNDTHVLPDSRNKGINVYLGIDGENSTQIINPAFDYSDKVRELSNVPLRLNKLVCDNYYYECYKAVFDQKKKMFLDIHTQSKNISLFDYTVVSAKADNEERMNHIILCAVMMGYENIITDINRNISLHYGLIFDKNSPHIKNKTLAEIMEKIIGSKYDKYQINQGYIQHLKDGS